MLFFATVFELCCTIPALLAWQCLFSPQRPKPLKIAQEKAKSDSVQAHQHWREHYHEQHAPGLQARTNNLKKAIDLLGYEVDRTQFDGMSSCVSSSAAGRQPTPATCVICLDDAQEPVSLIPCEY